jgi:threonine synthase
MKNNAADESLSLLDGATSQYPLIAPEREFQKQVAADKSRPMAERLEAFEDIVDSEVGDTILSRARNTEREVGLRQIYLKFEGGNPTGTQKDRIAFAQAMDAMRRGYDAVTLASCGNYGAAMAFAASAAGLAAHVYIPATFRTNRVQEIVRHGASVIRVAGDYEVAVEVSRERSEQDEIYDANPGGTNTDLQLKAYGEIANEIYDELRDAPYAVAVPVSNGTCLAGIYKGFLSLYRRGKTSRMPKMVAGSSHGKNPIVRSFIRNAGHCADLECKPVRESAVNEPLINWHSFDGDYALEAIRLTNGWVAGASDKAMLAYSKLIREREGLNVLPASTAGLIALLDQHGKQPLPGDRYVVVLTGKKS